MSSVVTISQSRPVPSDAQVICVDSDTDPEALEIRVEFDPQKSGEDAINNVERTAQERDSSLAKLQGLRSPEGPGTSHNASRSSSSSRRKLATAEAIVRRNPRNGPDAVIVLKEEKVRPHQPLRYNLGCSYLI